jgi:hypothetical protein
MFLWNISIGITYRISQYVIKKMEKVVSILKN